MGIRNAWHANAMHWTRTGVLLVAVGILVSVLITVDFSGGTGSGVNGTTITPGASETLDSQTPQLLQIDISDALTSRCPTWGADDGWDLGEQEVGRTVIRTALTCSMWEHKTGADDWAIREYLIPSNANQLHAVVGLTNETDSTQTHVQTQIIDAVTGNILYDGTATYGVPIQVQVSVAGVLRATFRAKIANPEDRDRYAFFVIGDVLVT